MYILKVNYLVDGTIESVKPLEEQIKMGECISEQYVDLSHNTNFGRCCLCQTWTSDKRKKNAVSEMSNGAILNGAWYCDVCLPDWHPNSF